MPLYAPTLAHQLPKFLPLFDFLIFLLLGILVIAKLLRRRMVVLEIMFE
jgi:hypothetical protein